MPDPERPARPALRRPTSRPGRLRYDAGGGRGLAAVPGLGSLLRAFDARHEAWRVEPRRGAAECAARLGWSAGRDRVNVGALVIDLSRGGARIFVDEAPPPGRVVTVFLEAADRSAKVDARVLDVRPTVTGQFVARVGFDAPCPYDLFEAAVCGLPPADPGARRGAV